MVGNIYIEVYVHLYVMAEKSYPAKIAIRSKGKFCVHVPKEFINKGEFKLGESVKVSLEKKIIKIIKAKNNPKSGRLTSA